MWDSIGPQIYIAFSVKIKEARGECGTDVT